MSTVIIFSYPLFGHVNYGLKIAKALKERNEEVYYYSTLDFKEMIEGSGIHFKEYKKLRMIGENNNKAEEDGLKGLYELGVHILETTELILQNDLEDIKNLKADYIIYDSFAYWGNKISGLLNVPAISSITCYAYNNSMIKKDPKGFIKNVLQAENNPLLSKGDYRTLKRLLDIYSVKLREKYNDPNFIITDTFFSSENLNLVFTSKMLQSYPETFDKRYLFVGPLIDAPKSEMSPFFQEIYSGTNNIVYISLGTVFNNNKQFFLECFKAFSNEDAKVFMSIGHNVSIEELGEIPTNFIIDHFLPQVEILKQADLFITHGGTNSVREALFFGVPMIVIPQGADQYVMSEDIERLRLGISMDREQVTGKELLSCWKNILLNKKGYKHNCNLVSQSLKNSGGLLRILDEIDQFKKEYTITQ
ncbi:macrolide family glycosyltransferase [Paenibacillus sp. FSL H3-0457]|uniref:macrolide family glycosyltransferase n=1 Tax=Paenibacillus sp. FSL H3-0457 TaxID=2921430 RepID=UPI0030ED0DEC